MKLTPERLAAFCAALAESCNVGKACAAVNISRMTAYDWRKNDPAFARAWEEATAVGITALEDEVHRRAFEGVERPLSHKGEFTYQRDFAAIDLETGVRYAPFFAPLLLGKDGQPVKAAVRDYSDTLAVFLLKAHAPDKYRENSKVEITGEIDIVRVLNAARQRSGG